MKLCNFPEYAGVGGIPAPLPGSNLQLLYPLSGQNTYHCTTVCTLGPVSYSRPQPFY